MGTPVLETDQKGDIVYIALTDVNGNAILRDERNDSSLQNKLYTGHKYDNVTGLTYAHARYLDTRTHTFTTVDPLYYQLSIAQLYNPQLMNAYSYANNNPVSNTDPTGLASIVAQFWSNTKAAVNTAITSLGNSYNTVVNSFSSSIKNVPNSLAVGGKQSLSVIAYAAVFYVAGPYVAKIASPIVATFITGAIAGVVGGSANRSLSSQQVNSKTVAQDAVMGATVNFGAKVLSAALPVISEALGIGGVGKGLGGGAISSIPSRGLSSLPAESQASINKYISNGWAKDPNLKTMLYDNKNNLLPPGPTYKEYYLKPGKDMSNTSRVVRSDEDKIYYSDDHYESFHLLDLEN